MAIEPIDDVAVPLGPRRQQSDGLVRIAERVKMVLDTRPGQLPWRSDFGCDLGAVVGEPITSARLTQIRHQIKAAITRWVREVNVVGMRVNIVRDEGMGMGTADRRIPLAEAALVRFGVQASLQIRLDLETVEGPLLLNATLTE